MPKLEHLTEQGRQQGYKKLLMQRKQRRIRKYRWAPQRKAMLDRDIPSYETHGQAIILGGVAPLAAGTM